MIKNIPHPNRPRQLTEVTTGAGSWYLGSWLTRGHSRSQSASSPLPASIDQPQSQFTLPFRTIRGQLLMMHSSGAHSSPSLWLQMHGLCVQHQLSSWASSAATEPTIPEGYEGHIPRRAEPRDLHHQARLFRDSGRDESGD
jgi:hypothetical protein